MKRTPLNIAYGSALLYFKFGQLVSELAGIDHEAKTKNNPPKEKNMDYWNNSAGIKIAKDIEEEYGRSFRNLPIWEQKDKIAEKVVSAMKKGELITNLSDKRQYDYLYFFEVSPNHRLLLRQAQEKLVK